MTLPYEHLALVENTETGLIHGAVYRNQVTPSGVARYVLAYFAPDGFLSEKTAAIALNAQFPHLEALPVNDLAEDTLTPLLRGLPPRAFLTHIYPQKRGTPQEAGVPEVEVRSEDNRLERPLPLSLSTKDIHELNRRKIIALVSSSGNDPQLYYRYDHYQRIA
jgi:hypothetical protein